MMGKMSTNFDIVSYQLDSSQWPPLTITSMIHGGEGAGGGYLGFPVGEDYWIAGGSTLHVT